LWPEYDRGKGGIEGSAVAFLYLNVLPFATLSYHASLLVHCPETQAKCPTVRLLRAIIV